MARVIDQDIWDKLVAQGASRGIYNQAKEDHVGLKIIGTDNIGNDSSYYIGEGGGNTNPTTPPPEIRYIYTGPNYSQMIQNALNAGKRGAQYLPDQYRELAENAGKDLQGQRDILDENNDLAYDTYLKNIQRQKRMNDDAWYSFRERLNNWAMLNNTQMNGGRFGSLNEMVNGLTNKTYDHFIMNNLANLREGKDTYAGQYADTINANANADKQNALQYQSGLRNLGLQYDNAVEEYIENIFATIGSYGDKKYVDSNGKYTQAGKDYIAGLGLGATVDANGKIVVDRNAAGLNDALAQAMGYNPLALKTPEYSMYRRSIEETNATRANKPATISKTKSQKNLSTPQLWVELENRYG